jgi:hypothetical protein
MAHKDKYEVARLYTDDSFTRKLGEKFEGDVRLRFHLAPRCLRAATSRRANCKRKNMAAG